MSNTGDMRFFVTFQKDAASLNAETPDWTDYLTGWPCDIMDVTGGQKMRGVQLENTTTHLIWTRYDHRIDDPNLRIKDDRGRTHDVVRTLDKDGRQEFLWIQTTQVTDG